MACLVLEVFREKATFGLEIGVQIVMIIQVILTQIGEDRHVVQASGHAVEIQGMGRDLHDHMGDPLVGHGFQIFLQFRSVGCGHTGRNGPAAEADVHRAQHACIAPAMIQYGFEQVGSGGFSVGSGYADHNHLRGRIPTQGRCGHPNGFTRIGNHDHRDAGIGFQGRIGQNSDRTGGYGLRHELPSIGGQPLQGGKKRTGRDGAGVVHDAGKDRFRVALDGRHV